MPHPSGFMTGVLSPRILLVTVFVSASPGPFFSALFSCVLQKSGTFRCKRSVPRAGVFRTRDLWQNKGRCARYTVHTLACAFLSSEYADAEVVKNSHRTASALAEKTVKDFLANA